MGLRGKGARPLSARPQPGDEAKGKRGGRRTLSWMKNGLTRAQRVIAFCEDLTVTSGQEAGQKLRLRGWQREDIERIYRENDAGIRPVRTAVLSMARKNGKDLALDTRIPTPHGWSTMGALKVDDIVFDERGQPCKVTYKSPVFIGHRCYRLTFADGSMIIAGEDHQWLTTSKYRPWQAPGRNDRWQFKGRHIRQSRSEVVTTAQISASLYIERLDGLREHNHKLRVAGALDCPEADLLVPPYVLGYWLGNGNSNEAGFVVGRQDEARIIEELERELAFKLLQRKVIGDRHPCYGLTHPDHRGVVAQKLRTLGVINNKHIPETYLWASRDQRFALLQGLMDSDGTASGGNRKAPRCCFDVMNEWLARDVLQLVRSLGFKTTIREDVAKIDGRPIGPCWSISFTAYQEDQIFRLQRRSACLPPRRCARSSSNAIVACDEVPSVPTVCIQVDSPSHLFLAGEGMTPTHNTQLAAALALCHLSGPECESRGEVYSCANDRFQAGKIFSEMVALISGHPYLTDRVNIIRFRKEIEDLHNHSVYAALSAEAKTKMGLSPSFVVYDELGQASDRLLYEAMDSALGARKEPLLLVISTQAADDNAPMSLLIDYGLKINAGEITDPSFHLTLYRAPEDADPWSLEAWQAANPALGDFRSLPDLERLALQAQRMPAQENAFRNLILNQRVAAYSKFIERSEWAACGDDPEIPDGARVYGGLDLGATRDMSALVLIHQDIDGAFHVVPHFWLPGNIQERVVADKAPYDVWIREGLITEAGKTTDPKAIALRIAELAGRYRLMTLAFDRWRINDLKRELDAIGCDVQLVPHGQGYKDMSPAVDIVERLVVQRRLRHGGNPVLATCVSNAVITRDPAGGRKLDKAKSTGRIDGLVALAMALGLALIKNEGEVDVAAMIG